MTDHLHTSDAIYHPIPQAPVAANAIPTATPDPDLDEETIAMDSSAASIANLVDSRIRWIHFLLGCAVLLPWNALITATPYFQSRVEGTPLRSTFSSYLSTTFTAANFAFLAHATATAKKASNKQRVLLSLAALSVLSLLLTTSTYARPPPGAFFAFVLLNAVCQAAAGSYLQTAVVAVAALFGPPAMQAVMSGQAAVAVAISGVQLLSALASVRAGSGAAAQIEADDGAAAERSAFAFFGLSTVFLVVCVGVHLWLVSLPAYKAVAGKRDASSGAEGTGLLAAVAGDDADVDPVEERAHSKSEKGQVVRIARDNATFNFAVAYVFTVTLAVFPPITVSVTSMNPAVHPLVFSALHFLMFNVGDLLGRTLCSLPRLHVWAARRLLALSLARTVFVPLFLLCNVQWASASPGGRRPIIGSDALFMLIVLLFGASNGYVSSMCMMAAPSVAHNPRLRGRQEDVEIAATVAGFCLVGGLAVGSVLSFAVRGAVCGCNPFVA